MRVGEIAFPLTVNTVGDKVTLADSAGTVIALNSRTGKELWRRQLGQGISAGVGSDGAVAAVVTKTNDLSVRTAQKFGAISCQPRPIRRRWWPVAGCLWSPQTGQSAHTTAKPVDACGLTTSR